MLHYKLDDITNGIVDSSGYGHNGTIIGTATLTSSPRYSNGISMNNTSTANRIDATSLPTEVSTVSLWIKGAKATNQVYFADKNSGLEFGTYSSLGATNLSSKALYNLTDFVNNEWNHIVVIKDSTNNKLYINGKLATTSSSNNYYTHNGGLYLFNRNANNNYACNGSISDFRAYCTILSEEDILALYHTAAKVDNLGGLHTFELKETGTVPQVLKKGIVQHGILREAAALNSGPTVSYKPAANASNSCATGVIVDFSEFADEGKPLTCTLDCDISWSGLTAGTGGTFRVLLQGSNRKKATNSFAWEGSNYVTNGYNFTSLVTANATNKTHRTYTFTLPATWFDTYNGSYFGIRTDYANGTGTITISNIKVTIAANSFKIKSNSIQAENLIEL